MKKIFLYNYEIFIIIFIKFFYNDLGIRALIIYFCFVLNDYKNIYSRNNNISLGVYGKGFYDN